MTAVWPGTFDGDDIQDDGLSEGCTEIFGSYRSAECGEPRAVVGDSGGAFAGDVDYKKYDTDHEEENFRKWMEFQQKK